MRRLFTILSFLICIPAATVSAQLVFKVCAETCPDPLRDPGGAAACHTRIAACETKLTMYNGYMAQLGAGVQTFTLPAMYRELLQPFYSANLANWRFGFSDRQPPGNATTDCNVTYFNRANFVTLLRQGALDGLWGWLFHELQHFAQCNTLGSRDAYAKMWFGHLEVAFIQNNDLATLHDRMIMESQADTKSSSVLESTIPIRDSRDRLVRPISVSLIAPGGATLGDRATITTGSYTITGKVTGGSDPLTWEWWIKRPGMSYYQQLTSDLVNDGKGFRFSTSTTGEYSVQLLVRQPDSNLETARRLVVLNVQPARKTGVFP